MQKNKKIEEKNERIFEVLVVIFFKKSWGGLVFEGIFSNVFEKICII